jgi:hypothetical protein
LIQGEVVTVPDTRIYVENVGAIRVYDDRSVDIDAVCQVRGPLKIQMKEDEFRWLFASMADIVRPWQQEEDAAR